MIDLLKKLELVSAQVVGKDKKGKIVKMNLDHEDLEFLKESFNELSLERSHYRVLAQKLRQDKKRLQDKIEHCNCCKEVDSEW